ncbi:MAG: acyltransferase [Ginsengibacter sp.]
MRIKIIDGFRAIAVLGVLWIHTWTFYGNPSYAIGGIDLAKLMSFFGNGVDLFFVISGFCMYLMYANKKAEITFTYYWQYLKKRWLRIAPAFYAAIIVYGLFHVSFNLYFFDVMYALQNALFIRTLFIEPTQYAPHFWSLCTEWHFYIILPFVLIGIKKSSFLKTMIITAIICLVFRAIAWHENNDPFNIINYLIVNRLIEFIIGIAIAYLYLKGNKSWINKRISGLFIGIAIAFAGRLLISAGFANRTDLAGMMARVLNLPLLTLGFGVAILNTLQNTSFFSRFLESKLMTSIGKYSYSMYLWHWVVAERMVFFLKGIGNFNLFLQVNLVFILSLLVLFPISKLSYILFESIYFNKKRFTKISGVEEAYPVTIHSRK